MSMKLKFENVAVNEDKPNWKELSRRQALLYERPDNVRTPFACDYTRILHSMAYRRLKHKTQVFFNIDNDHICTRMEHMDKIVKNRDMFSSLFFTFYKGTILYYI